ncbi:hypothetical protein GCM10027429_21360 [Marivirga atlantica]
MDLIRHISSFCKKYSVLLAVALIACCATKSFAQTTSAPVQVNSQLTPPYSIYLSDYTNDALNKWPITLNLRDFTKSDYRVRLRITIESQTVRFRTKPSFMPQGMYLTPGVPTQVTYDKLAAYLNPNNMEMSGINPATFANSQQLPEGFYTFTIEVLDYQRGNVVSNTSRNIAWIVQNEPPLLNLPFEEKVRIQDPQQIQFQWTPRHTSSPNSAFETEYIFRLWEIWPAGRNPFEVVRTSNPVFEQRTNLNSYFYGPGDIPLIPGRSYAWQVQAVSNIGRDLFKNNGRSEVKSFQYGDECLTVTGVGLEALGPDRIKVDWTGDWNHSGYVVEVREKGTTDWTTYATNIETQVVFDLEAGTEYEVQVKSTCGVLTGVASDIISVSTLDASEIDFECGADPNNPAITNRDPIESLQIGDRIEALGFKVRITEITGAGPYNGKGAIEVPLFNLASVEADLVNIEVNTDRKLIGGYVETTLNPAGPFIVGLDSDELDEGNGGADGDNVEDTPDTDIKVDEVISDVDVDEETGVITVTTEDGETTTIDPSEEGVDENGDGVVVVEDSNGDTWVVGPDGNVSQGQNTGGPSNPNTLPSDANVDFIVNFEKSDQQQYGFDTKSLETLTSNYTQTQIRDNDYWIPWKSVASGRTDKVLAKQSAGNSFNSAIGFKSVSGNLPITASAEDLAKNVTVQGTTHKDTQLVQAYVLKENQNEAGETTEEEIILGELNVVSYDKVAQKVIIVPVNGASAPAASTLSADLNRIYGQAVAEWELVMADNYTAEVDLTNAADEAIGDLAFYPPKIKALKKEYKKAVSIDRDAFYVFVLPNNSGNSVKGYMPFKKQFGYVLTENTSNITKTIAHELGHGAYRLRHTFSNEAYYAGANTTDNLMDLRDNGIDLYKHQWDFVHDPENVNTLFEDDDESAMGNEDLPDFMVYSFSSKIILNEYDGARGELIAFDISLSENLETDNLLYDVIDIKLGEFDAKNSYKIQQVLRSSEQFVLNLLNDFTGTKEEIKTYLDSKRSEIETYLNNQISNLVNGDSRIEDFDPLDGETKNQLVSLIDEFEQREVDAKTTIVNEEDFDAIKLLFEQEPNLIERDIHVLMTKSGKYEYFYRSDFYTIPTSKTTEDGAQIQLESFSQSELKALNKAHIEKSINNPNAIGDLSKRTEKPLNIFERGMWVVKVSKDLLEDIEVPEPMWNSSIDPETYPFSLDAMVGGMGDGVIDEFKSIPELIVLGLSLFDEDERRAILDGITSIDLEMIQKMVDAKADKYSQGGDIAFHEGGYDVVQVASLFWGGAFLKGGNKASDATGALADLYNKIPNNLKNAIDETLDEATKSKFLSDIGEMSNEAFEKIANNPNLVNAWKFLDDAGVDETLRRNVDALADPDAALDAIQMSQKAKPTWPEIQVLWKRGNDYNAKARLEYGDNKVEVVLKGVDGKAGKRLDTYLPPENGQAGQIISRKATTLSEIQPNTFKNYLNELITKYPKGAELNSSKFPSGTTLDGDYFLEIPTSNKSFFESSAEFQKVLSDFNTSKGVDIKIKYLDE